MSNKIIILKSLFIVVFLAATAAFSAGYIELSVQSIDKIQVYPEYGDGDIVLALNNMTSPVKGVHLGGVDKGTKSSWASIMQALTSGYKIRAYYDDKLWSCTSCGTYYHIATVEIFPSGVIK